MLRMAQMISPYGTLKSLRARSSPFSTAVTTCSLVNPLRVWKPGANHLKVNHAVVLQIFRLFVSHSLQRLSRLGHGDGFGKALQVSGQVAPIGSLVEPFRQGRRISSRQLGVLGVPGQFNDRLRPQGAIQVFVQQHLGDGLQRGFVERHLECNLLSPEETPTIIRNCIQLRAIKSAPTSIPSAGFDRWKLSCRSGVAQRYFSPSKITLRYAAALRRFGSGQGYNFSSIKRPREARGNLCKTSRKLAWAAEAC